MFSPVNNYTIPLISLLQNNKEAINNALSNLTTRGYTFIKLPPNLINQIDNCMKPIEEFFSDNIQNKKQYFKAPIFGYFNVEHKQSFRMLTGSRLNEHKFPQNFDKIKDLVHTVDNIMYTLSFHLFPNILADLHKSGINIPMFSMQKQWGMFDIAKYNNDKLRNKLNCEEHYDPGLLSLSLRSTEPGLQLKDEYGRWIDAGIDKTIAILWAGKAASQLNPRIKEGVHRVVNPGINRLNKPRIALWHEVCTAAQEHTELLKAKTSVPVKKATEFESKSGIPFSKSMAAPAKKAVDLESKTGIPFSKIMPTGLGVQPKVTTRNDNYVMDKRYRSQSDYLRNSLY